MSDLERLLADFSQHADANAGPIDPATVLSAIRSLRQEIATAASELCRHWDSAIRRPEFRPCAENLATYLALRQYDLSGLQGVLAALGLSSLGRCEGHVATSLSSVETALARMCGAAVPFPAAKDWDICARELRQRKAELFGRSDPGSAIMVTLPSEAATDPAFVEELVRAGMDCARINCAHDSSAAWAQMAGHVRSASARLGRPCHVVMDLPGPKSRIETLSPPKPDRIHVGSRLRLAITEPIGVPVMTTITISFPDAVRRLPLGAEVWIDDGKLRCRVVEIDGEDRILSVYGARDKGVKLRAEKGVNLPGTALDLPQFSADDLEALPHIAELADIVGLSFAQRPGDILELDRLISSARPDRSPIPIILKIETPAAVHNLPQLIIQAAGTRPTAVMIARGDLAVELGHARLAEIQEETLWLCEAAAVPVVWATQVLDELVKDGLPTRAETTDAAMAQRAECIMLNKGPHVIEGVRFLADIVGRMRRHQQKKNPLFGPLHSWPLVSLTDGW